MQPLIESLRSQPEYQAYLRARTAMQRIKEREARAGGAAAPSGYWREELAGFDYMLDASPLIVNKLRHHCHHVTGLRPYEYRSNQDGRARALRARLEELLRVGDRRLLVPEAPLLGGYGFDVDGGLYNVDTLKYFEVLIGMDRSGCLDPFRRPGERAVALEIGAGWGGFAYQFKTLFPDSTYVIVDLPELFLFSLTYLQAAFPGAKIAVLGENAGEDVFKDWRGTDFILVPNSATEELKGVRPDLALNMVSFQEMTTGQVLAYVHKLADLGCRRLYSLNRDRSSYNKEITSVRGILSRRYALERLKVLETSYTAAAGNGGEREPDPYVHTAGRLKAYDGVVLPERAGKSRARVGIGMTLYNKPAFMAEAVDSLLAQTFRDFILVLLDDGDDPRVEEIGRRYAAADPRVHYVKNPRRLGLVGAWGRVLEVVRDNFPGAPYFAWAGDHDRWEKDWLEALVDRLDSNPRLALAYPLHGRLDAGGSVLSPQGKDFLFQTEGLADLPRRFSHVSWNMVGSGNMIYGLFRADALAKVGAFPRALLPDRLLLTELSLHGEFAQVERRLWWRRYLDENEDTLGRQRSTLFTDDGRPLAAWLPWWLVHGFALIGRYGFRRDALPALPRRQRMLLFLKHLARLARKEVKKTLRRWRKEGEGAV